MRRINSQNKRLKQIREKFDIPIEEVLRRKYVDESKSIKTIAKELDTATEYVYRWLKEAGITSRNLGL